MNDINRWLEDLDLGRYVEAFQANAIDIELLPDLDEADLEKIGVAALGHRKKLLRAIAELGCEPASTPTVAETTPSGQVERRQLTVMFCDLVGSTELSRRLDPEDLREVMRRYQDTVAGLVARFEGHVAKFLGDGVLAFFGWPRAYEDQAERAVRSGLAAIVAVANLKTEDGQTLEARVGIATGQVVIGDIVGETAAETDAVAGETPNLAARLQGLAAPGQVVIGSTTRLLIGETFELAELGAQSLKGFAEPVAAWWVVGESAAESRFEAAHPGALTHIVGREHELGLLKRAWQQSQAGVGQVVLISGEPGIGKSRLVDALSAVLGDKGYTRITLSCSPYHTNSALFPLIVHLERVLRWQHEDSADVKLAKLEEALQDFSLPLDEAIPLFASLLSLPLPEDRYPPISVTPQQQKQQTLDATVAWLLEEAERQPVLQVWEDLHWADPSTLELLALEIDQTPTVPILNVLTFRTDFAPPWPQRSHMTPLTLNRLERAEVEALIGQHTGGKALPEEVVEHIVDKTDGVPLYVEELTKAILEADFLHETAAGYELAGPLSDLTIPATLQDSLMARLDRLPNIREVAQLGAVLGREFAYEMVRAIASMEETTLQNGLDQLVAAELLYQRGRPPRAKYFFKHALVQDAAYQSLLKSTRQAYHKRIAQILEERFPEIVATQPEFVAFHYSEAKLLEPAIEYWRQAAQRAKERSANMEAIAHATKGLELISRSPESPERDRLELVLQLTMGPAVIAVKGYGAPEVMRTYSRARQLCQKTEDREQLFETTWGLWISAQFGARISTARGLCEELLTIAAEKSEPSFQLQAHHAAWTTMLSTAELAACRQHAQQGIALYDREQHRSHAFIYGGHDPGVCAFNHMSQTSWFLGYAEQAVENTDLAIDLAEKLSHPLSMLLSHSFAGWLHNFRREPELVKRHAEIAIKLSDEYGIGPHYRAAGLILSGWARAANGETEEGIARIRDGLETYRASGTELRRSYLLSLLAEVHGWAGQCDEALELISEAFAHVEGSGERRWEAELSRLKGNLLLRRSKSDQSEAERCFMHAVKIAHEQGAKVLELRAATSLAPLLGEQGKRDQALALLAPVYDWFTEGFDTPDLRDAKALLDKLA